VLQGGATRRLAELPFPATPVWSPRGDAIVVPFVQRRRVELRRIDVRTGRTRDLSPGLRAAFGPSWSPSGSRIVFTVRSAGADDVWVTRADGRQRKRLVTGGSEAVWSSRGDSIAHFRDHRLDTAELWTMRPDGTGARRHVRRAFVRGLRSFVWSPDGRSLLFLRKPAAKGYYPASSSRSGTSSVSS
jgi:TolB protein